LVLNRALAKSENSRLRKVLARRSEVSTADS